ncbi:MAG: hypothetical protein AAGF11_35240 [Myxococcota bacterium]
MDRPKVAVLDDPVKVELELGKLEDLELAWVGHSVDAMMDVLPQVRPQVLVLQFDCLGSTPITRAQLLTTLCEAQLTIVTYTFARGYVLDSLRNEAVRTVKEPLTPDGLCSLVAEGLGTPFSAKPAEPITQVAEPITQVAEPTTQVAVPTTQVAAPTTKIAEAPLFPEAPFRDSSFGHLLLLDSVPKSA